MALAGRSVSALASPWSRAPRSLRSPASTRILRIGSRYRNLVTEAVRLRDKIETERELYADANPRNYRRGSKRHRHLRAGAKAAEKLAEVEEQLATIEHDARRAGVLRGWLNRIQIELEDEARRPAVAVGPGDEGRNPLRLESEDDASPIDSASADAERNARHNPLYLEHAAEAESRTSP